MSTLTTLMRSRALRLPRSGVPWATVATLGATMSSACAFWLVSLQGAIGSTERAETPFATFLMLAVVLLPMFFGFVLGALVLARRWFGPVAQGLKKVLPTALLLVAAGTLAGLVAIVASSTYDYTLQLHHIQDGMQGMATCTGSCIPRERHDILVLHVRGVLLVGRWLLLTNAALVAWLVVVWGERITLATASSDADWSAGHQSVEGRSLVEDVRLLLFGALLGAAVIHAAVVHEHLEEWSAAGRFFAVLTVAELAVAGLLMARVRERAVLLAAGALTVVPLVAWLWSRTVGLPFGPEPGVAEAIGVPDVLACLLEVGALLAVLVLLKSRRLARPNLSAHSRALVVVSLVAVTAIGFVATAPSWFNAFGVTTTHSMELSERGPSQAVEYTQSGVPQGAAGEKES